MDTPDRSPGSQLARWVATFFAIPVMYVLSSGPLLGLGFWLREATGQDEFYIVMFLFYPLIAFGHGNPVDAYIEWWVVDVFHTVGPG